MDDTVRAYLRRLQAGEGDLEYYLHLLERAGQVGPFVSSNLPSYHSNAIRHYLLHSGSLEYSRMGEIAFIDKRKPILDAIAWLISQGLAGRALILSPAPYIPQWQALLNGYQFNYVTVRGHRQTSLLCGSDNQYAITLVSYDAFAKAAEQILQDPTSFWPVMVCDETSMIRYHASKRHKAVVNVARMCGAKWRIAITSTAVTSRLEDIHALYQFIDPSIFPKKLIDFQRKYMIETGHRNKDGHRYSTWKPQEFAIGRVLNDIKSTCIDIRSIP